MAFFVSILPEQMSSDDNKKLSDSDALTIESDASNYVTDFILHQK